MSSAERASLRESWQARVAAFLASGLSAAKWCAENQVTESRLWYWVGKFRAEQQEKSSSSTDWVAVQMDTSTDTGPLHVRIGQVEIEVKPGYNPELLRGVVRTLMTLC
ncbi:hypothetical protein Alches_28440 [Alicyclobacillus hesperidum subsp. aegles]|uniref:IS66 family insertion sequence element accessory protein TnpA n=1 Tax=Alicyclobacillus hesperidum TaxID=89784 RepID=UPI00222AF356|nr:helix-turn-helix domain-containing protein [Alicyclobacillus hesperidum]GLG02802.1 hypothetical protein Alches_28440 [Alicyclobacillus hesperidum subsp. aegles]